MLNRDARARCIPAKIDAAICAPTPAPVHRRKSRQMRSARARLGRGRQPLFDAAWSGRGRFAIDDDIEERGTFEERPVHAAATYVSFARDSGELPLGQMSLPCGADRRCAGARRLRQLRQFCKVQLAEHTEELPRQPVARLGYGPSKTGVCKAIGDIRRLEHSLRRASLSGSVNWLPMQAILDQIANFYFIAPHAPKPPR